MQTILLTGFMPFDHETMNPSWEVVQRLDNKQIQGTHQIVVAQLACEFGLAIQQLHQHLQPNQQQSTI